MKHYCPFLLFVALLCSCQHIDTDARLQPVKWSDADMSRNVLLVEFTGIGCNNCPTAADEAHRLAETFDGRLIVVAMHPASNNFTHTINALYDYTCPEADTYYQFLGGTATTPFPTGNIDFSTTTDSYLTDYTLWGSNIMRDIVTTPAVNILLNADADGDSIRFNADLTHATTEALTTRILLWLTEDSIVGPQRMPDGSTSTTYVHNNMLRCEALGGGWGVIRTLNEATHLTQTVVIPDNVSDISHCAITLVVLDDATRNVLNAAQTHL